MVLGQAAAQPRLADVLSSCYLALFGSENPLGLGRVKKAAVLVVDGLGAHNLRERKGHARWLHTAWSRRSLVADSGFPSTTASALTSLTTGVRAGLHGIVGYTIRDPASHQMINHLKNWAPHVDPATWQLRRTLFEQAADAGIPSLALGEPRFAGTDFTKAVWRGAPFQGVRTLGEQGQAMREFFDSHDRGLVYLYWPALDRTGHSQGASSEAWTHRLEEVDADIAAIARLLHEGEGLVVTADHGMVDVLSEHRMILEEDSPLLDNVAQWGGEPRAPQLYLDTPDAIADSAQRWSESLGEAAVVMTRERLLDEGWLGPMGEGVPERLGDLIIACTQNMVVYRRAGTGASGLSMVGQHGSITPQEREIPVIPLGQWA